MITWQAWRSWRHAKGVGLLAAAALAAGIGGATAIYSVVNAVMLKPLPYRDGDRYVALFSAGLNNLERYGSLSAADAEAFRDRTRAFDAFGWYREAGKNLTFAGEPHHVEGVAVTAALVRQLGVDPMLGQWFSDSSSVTISRSLWTRLGADRGIVGKPLTLDGRPYTVAGVMPEWFHFPVAGMTSAGVSTDVWMPLDSRESAGQAFVAYARRKPGVSFAAAEADVKRVAAGIAADSSTSRPDYTARLFDLRETVARDVRPTLILLLSAAGLLFLITCANAAALLMARAVARARETAIRVALGPGRMRLAAQYCAEAMVVSVAGAAGGILISLTVTPAIVAMAADYLPRADDISIDWTVLLFALGAAIIASALSGMAPLWQAIRTAPAEILSDGVRASAGRRSRRVLQALVVGEIALAFVLLAVSAALFVHVRSLSRTSVGFDADRLLTFVLSVPTHLVEEPEPRAALHRRVIDALSAIPGVESVALASDLPMKGCCFGAPVFPDGRPEVDVTSQRNSIMAVSPEYFDTLRIPVRRGRTFTDHDAPADDMLGIVINETAARRFWGTRDPVGAFGRVGDRTQGGRFQVIGVVGDVKNDGLTAPVVPEIYIPSFVLRVEAMNLALRSERPVESLMADVRRVIRRLDPEQPIHEVATMRGLICETVTLQRAASFLIAFFAGAALLMAMLGVYGVVSYAVRQQTTEIGTRMALGETSGRVLGLIMRGALKMAGAGGAIGVVAALGAGWYLGRVFETAALGAGPLVYSGAAVGLVALAASAMPAWRASGLSPMVAIRNQPESAWSVALAGARKTLKGLSSREESQAVSLGDLVTGFASAVQGSASFREAIDAALATLRARLSAQSILLLEQVPGGGFRAGDCSLPADGVLLTRLRQFAHPLPFDTADLDAWLRWAAEFRPDHAPEIETLTRCGARIAVGLRTRSEMVGVLLLGAPDGRERYTAAERDVLDRAADVLALMIENGRLTERAIEQEKVRRDLALAAEVQQRLLPAEPPDHAAASLAAFTLPARTVGGDYYDFLRLAHGRMGIAVADVSGKGISAALLMSVVQASLRVITAEADVPPADLACRMNGFLYQSTGSSRYATFFYAQLDGPARQLRYVNAGHNPPYLVRRTHDGVDISELSAGGTVLGLFQDVSYEDALVSVCPGDLIVAFTDGVPEARNPEGEEFGEDRLKALLRESIGRPPGAVSSMLVDRMRAWIGAAEQHDDLTVVVVSVN